MDSETSVSQTEAQVGGVTPKPALDGWLDRIVCGDSGEILRGLPDESIDVVVTSPPYFNQRDYGTGLGAEANVDRYIDALLVIFRECVRTAKKDGSLFFNLGDKYSDGSLLLVPYQFAHRAAHESGVKLINQITWVKPNPEPRQFKRRLVSATEPIFHFVRTDSYRYYPERFLEGLDISRERRDYKNGKIGESYFGLIERSDLSDAQKSKARIELEEVIREVKEGKLWSFRMKIRGTHSAAYGGYEGGRKDHIRVKGFTIIRMFDRPMKRDVISTPIIHNKYLHHPAVYPETLVRECLNLTTERGDVVLDPFLGSGTTAVVAKTMGRHYVGIESNPLYSERARKRLKATPVQANLLEFDV